MRVRIFGETSDPSTDSPIVHKSVSYAENLVRSGLAERLDVRTIRMLSPKVMRDPLTLAAGSGFDTAWHMIQSGYAGPLTWQLKAGHA
jgi:hypothetical protein